MGVLPTPLSDDAIEYDEWMEMVKRYGEVKRNEDSGFPHEPWSISLVEQDRTYLPNRSPFNFLGCDRHWKIEPQSKDFS